MHACQFDAGICTACGSRCRPGSIMASLHRSGISCFDLAVAQQRSRTAFAAHRDRPWSLQANRRTPIPYENETVSMGLSVGDRPPSGGADLSMVMQTCTSLDLCGLALSKRTDARTLRALT